MKGIGKWMSKHGEAIYSTRKWKIYGEGTTTCLRLKKTGRPKWNFTNLNAADIRFTRSKDNKTLLQLFGYTKSKTYTVKTLAKGKSLQIKASKNFFCS